MTKESLYYIIIYVALVFISVMDATIEVPSKIKIRQQTEEGIVASEFSCLYSVYYFHGSDALFYFFAD